jgi:hypothetical protein
MTIGWKICDSSPALNTFFYDLKTAEAIGKPRAGLDRAEWVDVFTPQNF